MNPPEWKVKKVEAVRHAPRLRGDAVGVATTQRERADARLLYSCHPPTTHHITCASPLYPHLCPQRAPGLDEPDHEVARTTRTRVVLVRVRCRGVRRVCPGMFVAAVGLWPSVGATLTVSRPSSCPLRLSVRVVVSLQLGVVASSCPYVLGPRVACPAPIAPRWRYDGEPAQLPMPPEAGVTGAAGGLPHRCTFLAAVWRSSRLSWHASYTANLPTFPSSSRPRAGAGCPGALCLLQLSSRSSVPPSSRHPLPHYRQLSTTASTAGPFPDPCSITDTHRHGARDRLCWTRLHPAMFPHGAGARRCRRRRGGRRLPRAHPGPMGQYRLV